MKDCLNFFSWYRHANWNTHRRFAIVNNSTTLYSRNVKLLRINFQVERLLVIENFSSIFIIFTTYKLEISQKVIDKFIQEFRTYGEQNYTCIPYSDTSSKIFYPTNSYQYQHFFNQLTSWNCHVEPMSMTCCRLRTRLCTISEK